MHEGIVGKAVPEAGHDVIELAGTMVSLTVLDMRVQAEVQRGVGICGGDDIPSGTTSADVIQRSETARDMIGLVECRRGGCNKSDMARNRGERREQGERLERSHRLAALEGLHGHIENGEMIRHEEGVELCGFKPLGERPQMQEVEIGVRIGTGIAPRTSVQANGAHESAEMHLLICSH